MKFRSRLFSVFFVLALLWTCGGLWYTSGIAARQLAENEERFTENQQAAATVGTATGATIFYAIILCTGIPALLLFGLLSWRNSAGIRKEQMHAEQLKAIRDTKPPTQ